MIEPFTFRRQGRRPAVWLAAGCLGFLAAAGLMNGAPYPLWIIWMSAGLPVLWVLATNPSDGIVIESDRLTLSPWRNPTVVARDEIDHIRVHHWTECRDVALVMRSGALVELNPRDLPDGARLRQAFRGVGLRVIEA